MKNLRIFLCSFVVILFLISGISFKSYASRGNPGTSITATPIAPTVAVTTPTLADGVVSVNNPLPGAPIDIFHSILNRIVAVFFFVVGLVLVGLIIYGGILYMVDAGNEENAKRAQKIITSAVIGVIIIGLTGVIIKFVEAILGVSLGL